MPNLPILLTTLLLAAAPATLPYPRTTTVEKLPQTRLIDSATCEGYLVTTITTIDPPAPPYEKLPIPMKLRTEREVWLKKTAIPTDPRKLGEWAEKLFSPSEEKHPAAVEIRFRKSPTTEPATYRLSPDGHWAKQQP